MKVCMLGMFLLVSAASVSAQKPEPAQDVSYCELVKTPQHFKGKRIRVRAIYRYGFEVSSLDSPRCCPERGAKTWVEIEPELDRGSHRLYRKFPDGMGLALATFEGKFESGGPFGDGGYQLMLTVDKIENLEGVAKISVNHVPAWVPKCDPPQTTQPR